MSTIPLDHVRAAPATGDRRVYLWAKRLLDIVLAATALVVLAPLLLVVALLVRWDSPGPILFRQKRVGARPGKEGDGQRWEVVPFEMLKFRSMVYGADSSVHEAHIKAYVDGSLGGAGSSQSGFKLASDPRITRVGRLIRRTSLDELPQLFNVLRGDMSLVGPRPVPTYEVDHYQEWHRARLAAWPGITGLWQVAGRGQLTFDEMVRLDIEYVNRQSLWLDVKILARTVPAVISGRGAR